MVGAVKVKDSSTCFAGDENARACVPWFISEHDACI